MLAGETGLGGRSSYIQPLLEANNGACNLLRPCNFSGRVRCIRNVGQVSKELFTVGLQAGLLSYMNDNVEKQEE